MSLIRTSCSIGVCWLFLGAANSVQAQGKPSTEAPVGHRQPTASSVAQEPEQTTPADKKLKELDEALAKKLNGICHGC